MCQALMEIMKPEIEEVVNTAVLQERSEAERKIRENTERVKRETTERVTE